MLVPGDFPLFLRTPSWCKGESRRSHAQSDDAALFVSSQITWLSCCYRSRALSYLITDAAAAAAAAVSWWAAAATTPTISHTYQCEASERKQIDLRRSFEELLLFFILLSVWYLTQFHLYK